MKVLIGYTGFVGSILSKSIKFDLLLNRSNIDLLYGLECDIICCGLPAEKWKINLNPDIDDANTTKLISDIKKANVRSFKLISTIDVFSTPNNVNEDDLPLPTNLAYSRNRYLFENFVSETYNNYQIVRLPGLFGEGLKKNIIYDLMNSHNIDKINSDSYLQWYPMHRLVDDLNLISMHPDIKLFNFCTEPLHTKTLVAECFPNIIVSESNTPGVNYNIKTKYGKIFGSNNDYMLSVTEVLDELKVYTK
jgi:nucleoside-diphosphate-sugar epimerase